MSEYFDLALVVPIEAVEWAASLVCQAGSGGVVEKALDGKSVQLLGSIPSEKREAAELFLSRSLQAGAVSGVLAQIPVLEWTVTPPFDWQAVLRHHHRSFEISGVRVRPPWEEPSELPEIVLEPGMAFGTGSHETTRLCLEALSEELQPDDERTLLDVGTGSGILALVALRRCPRLRAVGCDIDLDAIESARNTALQNGLLERFELYLGRLDPEWGRFPLIVANLQWNVFQHELERIAPLLAPGGTLLCSGLLLDQAEPMTRLAKELGLEFRTRVDRGEWTLLRFLCP